MRAVVVVLWMFVWVRVRRVCALACVRVLLRWRERACLSEVPVQPLHFLCACLSFFKQHEAPAWKRLMLRTA